MNMEKKVIFIVIGVCASILILNTILILNKPYTIHFATDSENLIKSMKVKKNSKIGKLDVPIKEGYEFLYWTVNGQKIDENYIVESDDTVLVANYKIHGEDTKYIVKFDTDGGSVIDDVEVNENEKVIEPTTPVKDGYIFKEWQLDGKTYDFNLDVTSDLVLKAIYDKSDAETFTVFFDTDGGSKINSKVVGSGSTVSKPVNPVKKGYIFKEWQLDGNTYNFASPITSSITLKAIYAVDNRKDYTVTFDSDGGTVVSKQTIKEGDTATKPKNPIKKGYIFKEWQLDGKTYKFSSKIIKNITLKAIYVIDEKKDYTVTFDTNGGTVISKQLVKEGNVVIKPENPIKKGYIFKEWQLDGKIYDFNSKIVKNITLTAVYTKLDEKISVNSILFEKNSYNLNIGDEVTINLTITPSNATNKNVTWSSSNNEIATVTNGKVKALKEGNVTITASVDGKSATANINIKKKEITYDYELVDVPGSTIGQVYIYVKSSENKYVNGKVTITYQSGASETIDVPSAGYLWPSRNTIKSITNVRGV